MPEALNWDKVVYKEAYVGGQFGIKTVITSEAIAAAVALHVRRPARYFPTLAESMLMSSKRHPMIMKLKLGADAAGRLSVFYLDFTVPKGPYYVMGPAPVTRAIHMLSSAYGISHIDSIGKLVFTNTAYGGAARGAGPPQTNFALESAIDMLAEKVGIDPLEFRKLNSLRPGGTQATGTVVTQWPFPELCDSIRPQYERAKREAAAFNNGGPIRRGVGVAAHGFGLGYPADVGRVSVEVNPDDSITVYGAIADPGEGNDSMLAQIAAHLLELPLEKVHLYTRATDRTEGMGPAAGSRITFMGGGALINAIEQLKQAMQEAGAKTYAGLQKAGKPTRYNGIKKIPAVSPWTRRRAKAMLSSPTFSTSR